MKQWDDSSSAARFIIGLFLAVGFFSFFINGIQQVAFVINEGNDAAPKKVVGYVGAYVSTKYGPINENDLKTLTKWYVSVHDAATTKKASAIVYVDNSLEYLGLTQQPEYKDWVSFEGIRGYHGGSLSGEVKEAFERQGIVVEPETVYLNATEKPPHLQSLLIWFIPVTLGFLSGLFLVVDWLVLLKKSH